MASLVRYEGAKDKVHFQVAFRFGGKRFLRSLDTTDEKVAQKHLANVRDALKGIKAGWIAVEPDCSADDIWAKVFSGGRVEKKHTVKEAKTLGNVIDEYVANCPDDAKEASSLATERTHFKRFCLIIGRDTAIGRIDVAEIESYIRQRQKQKGLHGRKIAAATIRKELATFSQFWNFAAQRGYVTGTNPVKAARKPKPDADLPFQTWEQIEKTIRRSSTMTDSEKALHWSCLYLAEDEIMDLLSHIRTGEPLAYFAIAFVAFTGCRRSEMMRATVADVDFASASIRIREKKKSRSLNTTYRSVRLHPKLATILKAYLRSHHDGGQVMFPNGDGEPLTVKQVDLLFKRAVATSRWSVIEGYHVLRHSFISLCAMRGISQAIIDAWVGHTTEQMRHRYRHLFPAELETAMERLFSYAHLVIIVDVVAFRVAITRLVLFWLLRYLDRVELLAIIWQLP